MEQTTLADFITEFYKGQRKEYLIAELVRMEMSNMGPLARMHWEELAANCGFEIVT